jgi:putative spermidine/putrescine transport system substrate-binding protein
LLAAKTSPEISLFTRAASPIITGMNRSELPKSLQTNSVLLPDTQVLEKSEFLYPLSQSTALKYLSLWQEIR